MGKTISSMTRVKQAAEQAGISIDVLQMPASTRTAQEAAQACRCDLAQIVKSLIFEGQDSGAFKLLLVSGANQVDLSLTGALVGEPLKRADPNAVRERTGFAIGGVAPIGHLAPIDCYIDRDLMELGTVYAAAGAPNALFAIAPADLARITGGTVCDMAQCR